MYDVIVVGGGPAGMNTALVLGRARRRVLVCDSGEYRNYASRAIHGYLTRDGVSPAEFRRIARSELARYEGVELREIRVASAVRESDRFRVMFVGGGSAEGRRLVVATGVVDELPEIPGFEAFFGRGVHHCPYCDGWEVRDRPLAVYGRGDSKGAGLALELLLWSRSVTLCTDGPTGLSEAYTAKLARHGIPVRAERIVRLEGSDCLERVVFEAGPPLECTALFFNTACRLRSNLALTLGCEADAWNCRVEPRTGKTSVPGLYVVGDASRDVFQVIVAAAEGAEAAVTINRELLRDDGLLD
ncbi:MAG TPA: NAD(P)/FAD-dependent oxidoreductase [Polyangiaceae bacterium]|nr:NAD(P)/FAD-dependent oxidoreductase [Polyangiaceae bacterium]